MNRRRTSDVLVLQFGGLGDLVLMSELISSLKARYAQERVTLACRREYAPIAALFPTPPDNVIGVDINPHIIDHPSEDLRRTLENLARQFHGSRIRLLIEGSLRPTWLTGFLAALLKPEIGLCCGIAHGPETVLRAALKWFRLREPELQELPLPPEIAERDRYGLLLDYLRVARVSAFPWRLAVQQEDDAVGWLNSRGLAAGSYVACFPGGDVNVPIKRWPAANFAHAIGALRRQGHSVLLLGSSAEEQELADIARAVEDGPVPLFCGNSTSLHLGVALISKAGAYLGNDTGPMHVAQAFGVPGVAIFGGGGQWPRYAPWAAGSVAMVHPLPCFGCEWDCFLGRGLCVESIPAEPVIATLLDILQKGSPEAIQLLRTVIPEILPVLADASARYRSIQSDRAERLKVILHLANDNEQLKAGRLRRLAALFD